MLKFTSKEVGKNVPYRCPLCCHVGIEDFKEVAQSSGRVDYFCPKCNADIEQCDAIEGIDYVIEGREYFKCDSCNEECVYEKESSSNPNGLSASYECANCGDSYSVSC